MTFIGILIQYMLLTFWLVSWVTPYDFTITKYVISDQPTDPFLQDYHHTRYHGGCFENMVEQYPYNKVVPFIQNFDLIVTSCGIDWSNPLIPKYKATQTCVWELDGRNSTAHNLTRIHIHSDYRHHVYFLTRMLPGFEAEYKKGGKALLVYTGGGDSNVWSDVGDQILHSPAVKRWVVEQNQIEGLENKPKAMLSPVGICERESVGQRGTDLRTAVKKSTLKRRLSVTPSSFNIISYNNSIHSVQSNAYELQRRVLLSMKTSTATVTSLLSTVSPPLQQSEPHLYHRILQESIRRSLRWEDRKERVLLCFGENGRPSRIKYIDAAKAGSCPMCDLCQGSLQPLDLWRLYGEYKYILSPWGNGPDCGRTWEIMLMGAVPVIDYWPGKHQ